MGLRRALQRRHHGLRRPRRGSGGAHLHAARARGAVGGGLEPRPRGARHRRHHRRGAVRPGPDGAGAAGAGGDRRRADRLRHHAGVPRPGLGGDRGDQSGRRRLSRRARPAGADLLGRGRALRRGGGLSRGQDRARPALRLPRHRHARHFRDHPRRVEERELADPGGQERHRHPPARSDRARVPADALGRRSRRPLRRAARHHRGGAGAALLRLPVLRRPDRDLLALPAGAALALGGG